MTKKPPGPKGKCPKCHREVEIVKSADGAWRYQHHDRHPNMRVICQASYDYAPTPDLKNGKGS